MDRGYLTYHEAYELKNRLGNFIAFYKAFKKNPVLLKSMFWKNINVKIGNFNYLEEAYETLNQMMEKDRIYN